MIKYTTDGMASADFSSAVIGDKFCVIDYGRWSSDPVSVTNYEIVKIGKRDIKCVSSNGGELIVKVEPTWKNPSAYECGGDEAKSAIEIMRLRKRQRNCALIVDSKGSGRTYDNDLMDAIEKFAERQKARGE